MNVSERIVTHADILKFTVTLVGCIGMLLSIGFIFSAYFTRDYWLGVLWLVLLTAWFILTLIARRVVDLMEKRAS